MSNVKKGISLVALIITIIVLIILTGAVIMSIGGDNSIINRAKQGVEDHNKVVAKEKVMLEINEIKLKAASEGKTVKEYLYDETNGETRRAELTAKGIVVTENGNELSFTVDQKYIAEADETGKVQEEVTVIGGGSSTPETPSQDLIATYEGIEVGDYVEYEPDPLPEGVTSVTVQGKTVTKENLKWRVLKKDGTNVTLISDAPTTGKITFSGSADWVNAPTILNSVCDQLYSKEGVGVARSINVDDVNEITGYNGNDETNWRYVNASGSIVSVPSNVGTIGELETSVGSSLTYRQTPEIEKSLADYAPNYYYYTGTAKGLSSNEMVYKLIFRKADDSGTAPTYWLSSSCVGVYFYNRYAGFDVRFVSSGGVGAYGVFNSNGVANSPSYTVLPLVTLGSNVQVDIEEGRDGTTVEKAWKIK